MKEKTEQQKEKVKYENELKKKNFKKIINYTYTQKKHTKQKKNI